MPYKNTFGIVAKNSILKRVTIHDGNIGKKRVSAHRLAVSSGSHMLTDYQKTRIAEDKKIVSLKTFRATQNEMRAIRRECVAQSIDLPQYVKDWFANNREMSEQEITNQIWRERNRVLKELEQETQENAKTYRERVLDMIQEHGLQGAIANYVKRVAREVGLTRDTILPAVYRVEQQTRSYEGLSPTIIKFLIKSKIISQDDVDSQN